VFNFNCLMRDDDMDIEALPASASFRFVSFRNEFTAVNISLMWVTLVTLTKTNFSWSVVNMI